MAGFDYENQIGISFWNNHVVNLLGTVAYENV